MITNVGTLDRGRIGPVSLDLDAVNARARFSVRGAKSGRVSVQARGTGSPSGNLYVRRVVPGSAAQDFSSAKTIPAAGGIVDLATDDLRGEDAIEVGRDAGALSSCWAEILVSLDFDTAPVATDAGQVIVGTVPSSGVRQVTSSGGMADAP